MQIAPYTRVMWAYCKFEALYHTHTTGSDEVVVSLSPASLKTVEVVPGVCVALTGLEPPDLIERLIPPRITL